MLGAIALVGLLFMGIGLVIFYLATGERKKAIQSQGWPQVSGEVTHSAAQAHDDEGHLTYYSKIVYRYTVDEQSYSSDRVQFGARSGASQKFAQRWSEKYPAGTSVQVYYDPSNPAEAILEPGSKQGVRGAFLIAAIFLFLGVAILVAIPTLIIVLSS